MEVYACPSQGRDGIATPTCRATSAVAMHRLPPPRLRPPPYLQETSSPSSPDTGQTSPYGPQTPSIRSPASYSGTVASSPVLPVHSVSVSPKHVTSPQCRQAWSSQCSPLSLPRNRGPSAGRLQNLLELPVDRRRHRTRRKGSICNLPAQQDACVGLLQEQLDTGTSSASAVGSPRSMRQHKPRPAQVAATGSSNLRQKQHWPSNTSFCEGLPAPLLLRSCFEPPHNEQPEADDDQDESTLRVKIESPCCFDGHRLARDNVSQTAFVPGQSPSIATVGSLRGSSPQRSSSNSQSPSGSGSGNRCWQRPHILQVELEEITLPGKLRGTEPSWFETTHYFISLHPSSARLPAVELPEQVPQRTEDGFHMVFAAQPALAAGNQCLCAEYHEHKSLRMDQLHTHFMLFLWLRRSSMFGAEVATELLGCRALPLRDASLYGRLAAWDISDVASGEQIAEARLRFAACTPPGPIQLPHLSEVGATELTLSWSAPLDDGGLDVLDYGVELLPPGEERWQPVCECTPSAERCCTLRGLTAATTYGVSIFARNGAGLGESCRLEVSTSVAEDTDNDGEAGNRVSEAGPG